MVQTATKLHYIERKSNHERKARWLEAGLFFLLLGGAISAIHVLDTFPEYPELVGAGYFSAFIIFIYYARKFTKWKTAGSGLKCNSCGAAIVHDQTAVTIATGACPACEGPAFIPANQALVAQTADLVSKASPKRASGINSLVKTDNRADFIQRKTLHDRKALAKTTP